MKITIILFAISLFITSCLKSYTCECTYVPNSINNPVGTPNKVETNTIKARAYEAANSNCQIDFQNKYSSQSYTGSCTIK